MNFDEAFNRVMGHEGGYVNLASDPGGETQWGISKRSYPSVNIQALTRDDARAIYKRDFWHRIQGDDLPEGVAYQIFDLAVNSGIETAIRLYQRALGVADDGVWGPISAEAARTMPESQQIMRLTAERLEFYAKLSTWSTFGRGWARRLAQNLRYGSEDVDA
jgi:lysozyme family protein